MARTEWLWISALAAPATALYVTLSERGLPPAGGLVGHSLGILGFLLMLFAWLGYSWRKRPTQVGPGTMQQWLQAHVVTGIVGPYFVLLHSAFAFGGLPGVLLLLTFCVVLSGIFGRYLFSRLPRPRELAALDTEKWRAEPAMLAELLPDASDGGLATALQTRRGAFAGEAAEDAGVETEARGLTGLRSHGALWWLLHVPLAAAVIALAIAHVVATLYYGVLLR